MRSDTEIIQQYLGGNKRSLDTLINRYLKRIHAFAYKSVGNSSDADDVTQEVFLKVWKNVTKFDISRNFKVWLFEIAKNTSIDFLRKRKTIPLSAFEDENGQNQLADRIKTAPSKVAETIDNKNALNAAMDGLQEQDKKIINLKHRHNFNFKEISEMLQVSVNTIKSRYRRAIIKIKNGSLQAQ